MARFNFGGGLRAGVEAFKGLLSGQAAALETEQAKQIAKEKRDAEERYRQARLANDLQRMEMEQYRIRQADQRLIAEAEKERKKTAQEDLTRAAIGPLAKKYGITVVPGQESEAYGEILQRTRPAGPQKPLRINPLQEAQFVEKTAQEYRDREFAVLKQKLDVGVKEAGGGMDPETGALDDRKFLDKLYESNDLDKLGLWYSIKDIEDKMNDLRFNPRALDKYRTQVRKDYNLFARPEEEYNAALTPEAVTSAGKANNPNAARIRALEKVLGSDNATEADINEYEDLVGAGEDEEE